MNTNINKDDEVINTALYKEYAISSTMKKEPFNVVFRIFPLWVLKVLAKLLRGKVIPNQIATPSTK